MNTGARHAEAAGLHLTPYNVLGQMNWIEKGFLKLDRRFFGGWLWNEARTYSRCEACLFLMAGARIDARDEAVSVRIGGREVSISRGQIPASIRFLSKAWRWTEKAVRLFLMELRRKKCITTDSRQGINVITLCGELAEAAFGTNEDRMEHTDRETERPPFEQGHTEGTNIKNGIISPREKENIPLGMQKKEPPTAAPMMPITDAVGVAVPDSWRTLPDALRPRAMELWREIAAVAMDAPGRFTPQMTRRFFDYWTEPDKAKGRAQRMLFEKQKTWQTSRRMATWADRDREWAGRGADTAGLALTDNSTAKYDNNTFDW